VSPAQSAVDGAAAAPSTVLGAGAPVVVPGAHVFSLRSAQLRFSAAHQRQTRVASLTAMRAAPAKVNVFLAVSPEEIPGRADFSAVMLSTARSMKAMLAPAAARGLYTRYQELPGENHMSTNLAAMSAILRQASGTP
jgi:hypothetical protein